MSTILLTITRSKTLLRALDIALDRDTENKGHVWTRYNGSCLDDLPIALARADLVLLDIGSFKGSLDTRSKNHIKALASRQALVFLHGSEDKVLLEEMLEWASCCSLEKPFSGEDLDAAIRLTLGERFPSETIVNSNLSNEHLSGRRARPAFDLADAGEPIEGPKFTSDIDLESGLGDTPGSINVDGEILNAFNNLKAQAEKRAQDVKAYGIDVELTEDIEKTIASKVSTELNTDSKEVQTHLRKLVEEYCQKNLGRIARQVLEQELQKVQKDHDRIRYGSSQT